MALCCPVQRHGGHMCDLDGDPSGLDGRSNVTIQCDGSGRIVRHNGVRVRRCGHGAPRWISGLDLTNDPDGP